MSDYPVIKINKRALKTLNEWIILLNYIHDGLLKMVLIPGKYVKIREQKRCIPWGSVQQNGKFMEIGGGL